MEDDVGLVINTHQLAFKGSVVLCGHADSLPYVGLLQLVLGCLLFLHFWIFSRVDYLYSGLGNKNSDIIVGYRC